MRRRNSLLAVALVGEVVHNLHSRAAVVAMVAAVDVGLSLKGTTLVTSGPLLRERSTSFGTMGSPIITARPAGRIRLATMGLVGT